MPATIPVASTDRVSKNTQNVMANQTVKFITETIKVLTSRCRNVRSDAWLRSMAGVFFLALPGPWSEWTRSSVTRRLQYS